MTEIPGSESWKAKRIGPFIRVVIGVGIAVVTLNTVTHQASKCSANVDFTGPGRWKDEEVGAHPRRTGPRLHLVHPVVRDQLLLYLHYSLHKHGSTFFGCAQV